MGKPVKLPRRGTWVLVEWLDAETDTGWQDAPEAKAPRVRSAGVLVNFTRHALSIAADAGCTSKPHEGHVNRILVIPRGMVRSVRTVKVRG